MGDHADQLGRARDANLGAMDTSVRQLSSYSSSMETTVDTLRAVGSEPGLEGAGADAATERFATLAREVATVADYLTTLAQGGAQATAAIVAAKQAYADLPDGELSWGERTGLTAATTVALPGFGTVTGVVAGEIISRQREAEREAAAATALNRLDSSLSTISLEPPTTARSSADPTTGTTGTEGGGTGPRGTNVSGGWSGGSTGGTSQGVGAYSPSAGGSAGLVGSSWTPGAGSTGGVPNGSSGPGGSSSGGTVGSDPIFSGGGPTGGGSTGGGSTGGGSGLGGGHLPGSGDGTSSDGLVGGTVPGGSGTGGGGAFLGGSGSSGTNGANGLAGLGAGGLAGGLTVGGAALGGAGLNRLAAGGGAGGLGGVGGLGGAGGVGGLGAGTGVPLGTVGAGTSGSGLSGSTSALVQGSQGGAPGAGASGARTGGMAGAPMGGGGGAGAAKGSKRRASGGLLAPDIDVEEGAERPDLGAAARAGGRDSLRSTAPVSGVADDDQDDW